MKNPRARNQSISNRITGPISLRKPFLPIEQLRKQGHLSTAPLSLLVVGNQQRPKPVNGKLFIVDWDDTLNASSWCVRNGILTCRPPSESDLNHVADLAQRSTATLRSCLNHGNVVIVTNAESGWVELSARQLMPEVSKYVQPFRRVSLLRHHRLLSMIPVISARHHFESLCRDAPISWKAMTFARIITEWFDSACGAFDHMDVISIGDSIHEREALFRVHKQHRIKFTPKNIKFSEHPSVDELVKQHACLANNLTRLVHTEEAQDVMISDTFVNNYKETLGGDDGVFSSRSRSLSTPSVQRTFSPSAARQFSSLKSTVLLSSRYQEPPVS